MIFFLFFNGWWFSSRKVGDGWVNKFLKLKGGKLFLIEVQVVGAPFVLPCSDLEKLSPSHQAKLQNLYFPISWNEIESKSLTRLCLPQPSSSFGGFEENWEFLEMASQPLIYANSLPFWSSKRIQFQGNFFPCSLLKQK